MDELDRLKLERDRLRAQEDADRQTELYEKEKRDLKKDIFMRKHKKTVKVVKVVGGVAKRSIGGVGMIFGGMARSAKPYVKQGLSNLAENARRESEGKQPRQVRKIVKKKAKKKSKGKKRKVVKKVVRKRSRSAPRQTSNIPRFDNFFG